MPNDAVPALLKTPARVYTFGNLLDDMKALKEEPDDVLRALARARIEGNATKIVEFFKQHVWFDDFYPVCEISG
jgi:hypothetical protein